jgi:hypothetical protein
MRECAHCGVAPGYARAPLSHSVLHEQIGVTTMSRISKVEYSGILAVSVALFLCVSGANAATLNVVSGQLVGASGVDVGGTLYDVEFGDGACIAAFDGCDSPSDFTFNTVGEGQAASQALLDQVFIDGVSGNFDSVPALTIFCENVDRCNVFTPIVVVLSANSIITEVAANFRQGFGSDTTFQESFSRFNDGSSNDTSVWALWTLVPEPSTALLIGLGLVGLAAAGKRK